MVRAFVVIPGLFRRGARQVATPFLTQTPTTTDV
jgi:hypothetical protein